jgi:CRP/FNR family transcriptional regulator, dissimilatory nitrate respiration regulator
MFRGYPRARLAELAGQARPTSVPRNAAPVRAGVPLPGLLVVLRGMLKVALPQGGRVIALLAPGESFGEASIALGRAPRLEVVALVESTVALLPREALLALLREDARLALRFARTLANQALSLIEALEANASRHGAQRLAAYLDSLARPGDPAAPCSVKLPASKTVIASLLGMKKETLSRLLRELSARQLIRVSGREIGILDRAGLAPTTQQPAGQE